MLPSAFWVLAVPAALAAFVTLLPLALLPLYLRDVAGIPLERVGVHVALVWIGAALLSAAALRAADRYGPTVPVVGLAALMVIGSTLLVLTASAEPLVATGAALLGATVAAGPVLVAAVRRVLAPARAPLGYALFSLCCAIGAGAGGWAAGALHDQDPRLPLLAAAALVWPVAALLSLALSRSPGGSPPPARLESAR